MAKRVNTGYMSGYFSQGSIRARPLETTRGKVKQREIDADTDICLTCDRPAGRCTGRCKKIKEKKKHDIT